MLRSICIVLLLCSSTASRAANLISNLGQPSSGFGLGVGTNNPATGPNLMRAETFKTGTNPLGYRLSSVTLAMGGSTGSDLGNLLVQLYDTSAFKPTSSIGDFIVPSNPFSEGQYTYAFSNTGLILAPATYYSVVVRSPDSAGPTVSQFGWRTATTAALDPASEPSWALFDNLVKTEGVSSWSSVRTGPYQFAIDATAVPEPTSFVLLAIGAWMLLTETLRR